jgi:hypothetical protein
LAAGLTAPGDILGRVYEYFLSQFAGAEGKKGGQFYTPTHVVRVLVEMLAPYKGRVYDPCCGSGGMFVQSEKFIEAHSGRIGDNLDLRAGIELHGDSFHTDRHPDLKANYVSPSPWPISSRPASSIPNSARSRKIGILVSSPRSRRAPCGSSFPNASRTLRRRTPIRRTACLSIGTRADRHRKPPITLRATRVEPTIGAVWAMRPITSASRLSSTIISHDPANMSAEIKTSN